MISLKSLLASSIATATIAMAAPALMANDYSQFGKAPLNSTSTARVQYRSGYRSVSPSSTQSFVPAAPVYVQTAPSRSYSLLPNQYQVRGPESHWEFMRARAHVRGW